MSVLSVQEAGSLDALPPAGFWWFSQLALSPVLLSLCLSLCKLPSVYKDTNLPNRVRPYLV